MVKVNGKSKGDFLNVVFGFKTISEISLHISWQVLFKINCKHDEKSKVSEEII